MVASKAAESKIGTMFSGERDTINTSCRRKGGDWCFGRSACAWTCRTVSIRAREGAESFIVSEQDPPTQTVVGFGGFVVVLVVLVVARIGVITGETVDGNDKFQGLRNT